MNVNKLLIVTALILSACTDVDGATEDIKNIGLTPINVGGYALFACSENDGWATKFTAKREDGQQVEGVVCDGILKGSTVRFR